MIAISCLGLKHQQQDSFRAALITFFSFFAHQKLNEDGDVRFLVILFYTSD